MSFDNPRGKWKKWMDDFVGGRDEFLLLSKIILIFYIFMLLLFLCSSRSAGRFLSHLHFPWDGCRFLGGGREKKLKFTVYASTLEKS